MIVDVHVGGRWDVGCRDARDVGWRRERFREGERVKFALLSAALNH
jgi:hypothetical protein